MNTLFMHCRPGFESEVCAEIAEHAARLDVAGYAKAKPQSACAEFICNDGEGAERLMRELRFAQLIFPASGRAVVSSNCQKPTVSVCCSIPWVIIRCSAVCGWR